MEHPSGITYQTDELERIERVRYALFLVFALALFVTFVLLSQSALWSAAFAASGALLASGWYAAHATTRDPAWAIVEAEARQDGGNPNKHSVWAANLLPGTAALCGLTLWLSVA